MNLFEQYEKRKQCFSSGVIWTSGHCVVDKLKIIHETELDKYLKALIYENEGSDYGHKGQKVYFEIIESEAISGPLAVGRVCKWYKSYIEYYYEPSLTNVYELPF